jgi:hypothetical protein
LKSPDITPAQVLAIVKFAVTEAVAFGLLQQGTGQDIVAIAGIVLPSVLLAVDSKIRGHRAQVVAAQQYTSFATGPEVHQGAPEEAA